MRIGGRRVGAVLYTPFRDAHDKLGEDGYEEYVIDHIVDARRAGRGHRYLVRWKGYGPEDDTWLPGKELRDCEALDRWEAENGGRDIAMLYDCCYFDFTPAPPSPALKSTSTSARASGGGGSGFSGRGRV